MGGRGSFATGNAGPYSYRTVGHLNGVKILEGIGNQHGLPAEAHTSSAYIKMGPNGFKEMRFYDKSHYLTREIAYHIEPTLDPSHKPILHIHDYKRDNFKDRPPRLLTEDEYRQYRKFLKEDLRWNPET